MEDQKSARTESKGSSPAAKTTSKEHPTTSDRPTVGSKFHMKTEAPAEPNPQESAFRPIATDLPAAGNTDYTVELKDEGRLGLFYGRDKTTNKAVPFYINVQQFYDGIRRTLDAVLKRMFHLKTGLGDTDYLLRIDAVSQSLASGCCLLAYLKVRDLLFYVGHGTAEPNSLRRPRADTDLAIPSAYAFAIQQLGIVHVADLDTDLRVYPRFPPTGHKFGIPNTVAWNPNDYARSVEYARNLGMTFSIVDTTVKNGTAWWLFRQTYSDDMFELICSYPEVNFTESMAATHSLFLNGSESNPTNAIISFANQTTTDSYGSMLREPHPGINVSSFEALSEIANEVWSHV